MGKTVALLLAICGVACGGPEGTGVVVDSDLPGIYSVRSYLVGFDGCAGPASGQPPPANRLVVYRYSDDNSGEVWLGGNWCSTVESCRDVARAELTPLMGQSFAEGDDESGWIGFALPSDVPTDTRFAMVHEHMLVRTADGIRTETRTHAPRGYVTYASARHGHPERPEGIERRSCIGLSVLEATFEAHL